MTNTEKLKQYLLEDNKDNNAFLLNSNNNGKTIMLSGAWGAGKTHFWQNEIEPKLKDKLRKDDKACVYVSLYGKESISEIKFEIFKEAYNAIVNEDIISKGASLMSSLAPSFGEKSLSDIFDKLNKKAKENRSKEILDSGSVICLDDFERKSKSIDLNDLFGLISHLALSLKCKVIIILNSDVFEAEEAEIFKRVKEKTVNKFFYFEPTIDELFESIFKDRKYDKLKDCKSKILDTIKETEELNARLYIQVLDNCLEWADNGKALDDNIIRVLVLTTINFVLNHMILDYQKIICSDHDCKIAYNMMEFYPNTMLVRSMAGCHFLGRYQIKDKDSYLKHCASRKDTELISEIMNNINRTDTTTHSSELEISSKTFTYSEASQKEALKWLKENEPKLKALWKYGYRLYYVGDVDKETYEDIAEFVKTGILLSKLTNEL